MSFLATLLVYVVYTAGPRLDMNLLRNMPSTLRPETAGAQSAITGTLWVISLTALFTVPIGVMSAIYLEEYADQTKWWNRVIEINILNLAAVPSIVYGILGLGVIARGLGLGLTVLAAAVTLSLLVLPVVIISAREAIRAVPQLHPAWLARAGRHEVADHLEAGPAGGRSGHGDRLDPGAVPGDRRGRAAAAPGRPGVHLVQP